MPVPIIRPTLPLRDDGASINKGLVGAWALSDGAGVSAYDWSGLKKNGTLVGAPSWVWALSGGALSFNGSTQYVTGSDIGFPTGSSSKTIVVRFKQTAAAFSYQVMFSYGSIGIGNLLWGSALNGSGGITITQYGDSLNSVRTGLNDGKWHTSVLTVTEDFITSISLYSIYIDGVFDSSKTMITNTTLNGSWAIGRSQYDASGYSPATIADVRVLNRILSASEILSLHTQQNIGMSGPRRLSLNVVSAPAGGGPIIRGGPIMHGAILRGGRIAA